MTQRDDDATSHDGRPGLRRALAERALETAYTQPEPARTQPSQSVVSPPDLEVGVTLGRGGMALVRAAQQLKLNRPVAVKALREECRSPDDIGRLVREAQIAARLEHPNIVPVHDLVTGPDGIPQVVLKLIEGDTWTAFMRDADRVKLMFGAEDLLEWNLEVLMTVARALSFAHSRGVLHRDIKPTNVMIGPFGEVYLVDWGIAFEMDSEIPENDDEILGTWAYMAPEQVEANVALLGPWTDTYLLGACLFQLLAGRPPHAGKSPETRISEVIENVALHELPEDVPLELKRIVLRALDPDPMGRTVHPEDFRLSIASFLRRRGALAMVQRGHRAFAQSTQGADERAAERAGQEAEFAYRAALEEWPQCEEAQEGLRAVQTVRIAHALEQGDPALAERLLEAQPDLPPSLHQQVSAALAEAEANEARVQSIIDDADRGLGHRVRGLLAIFFGVLWIGFWGAMSIAPPATVTPLVLFIASCWIAGVVGVLWRRKEMLESRINRTAVWATGTGLATSALWCVGAAWLGLDVRTVMIGLLMVSALFTSSMANLVNPWGAVGAVGFAIAFLLACARPDWLPYAMIGGNVVLLANQVILNWVLARKGFEALPALLGPKGSASRSQQRRASPVR